MPAHNPDKADTTRSANPRGAEAARAQDDKLKEDVLSQDISKDRQTVFIVDALSEGPIYGLVDGQASVFLNNDRVAPLNQSAKRYNSTGARIALQNGQTSATISGTDSSTPIILGSNGDKFLIVRGGIQLSTPVSAAALVSGTTNSLTVTKLTRTDTNFSFTTAMVSNESSMETTIPVSLKRVSSAGTPQGFYDSGEGYIRKLVSSSVVEFIPGPSGPTGVWRPEGSYTLTVDKIVKVASVSGNSVTLTSNWTGTTGGYEFDVSGMVVSGVDEVTQTEISNYEGVTTQFRTGTLAQSPFLGIGGAGRTAISNNPGINAIEQSTGYGGSADPIVLQGTVAFALTASQSQAIDEVRIGIGYPGGFYAVNGKGEDRVTFVQYKFELALKRPGASSFEAFQDLNARKTHSNMSKNAVIETEIFQLSQHQPFTDFKIRISRLTSHNDPGYQKLENGIAQTFHDWQNITSAKIDNVTAIIKEKLTHPFTAMAKTSFTTKQFSGIPERSFHVKGLKIQVPSNYITRDESATQIANYNRNVSSGAVETTYQDWDGAFRQDLIYTNNPAWVFYDILINNRYGLGDFLTEQDIDKYSLYRIARYCDELVSDGKGGQEPRFTANLYLTKSADAYKVLKDISTIFRSMVYYLDGSIVPIIDAPSGPVYNFSKANVIDGAFSYESTGSKTRVNQVIVSWNNPESNYIVEPLLVEDRVNIAETGKIISQDSFAMGTTSEMQAIRYGRWKLWTAANQKELVTFQTALNASSVNPGDIINIQDSDRNSARYGGRVSATGTRNTTTVPLDSSVGLISGSTYALSVVFIEPGAFATSEVTISGITYGVGDLIKQAFIDDNGNGTYTLQDINTEAKSVNAKATATATDALILKWSETTRVETQTVSTSSGTRNTLSVSSAFTAVPPVEAMWVLTETNANSSTTVTSAKQYKVLGISENSKNEFSITAVEYYDEKFAAVDEDFTTYVADTVLPAVRSTDIVPPLTDLKIQHMGVRSTEVINISWEKPVNSIGTGEEYEHYDGVEITHNIPEVDSSLGGVSPYKTVSNTNTHTFGCNNAPIGTYTISARVVNILGNKSEALLSTFTITGRYKHDVPRLPLGVPYRGSSSVGFQVVNDSITKDFKFKKTNYKIKGPSDDSQQVIYAPDSPTPSSYSQDCKNLTPITYTENKNIEGAFVPEHAYILLDVSETTDKLKLIKYNKSVTPQFNSSGALVDGSGSNFWYDSGTGNTTAANSFGSALNGSVSKPSRSSKVTGNGTAFTTDLQSEDILKVQNKYYRVISIQSDTVLYIDVSGAEAWSSISDYRRQQLRIDYVNDTIIARVYRDDAASGDPLVLAETYVSIDAEVKDVTATSDGVEGPLSIGSNVVLDGTSGATHAFFAGSTEAGSATFKVSNSGVVEASRTELKDDDGHILFNTSETNPFGGAALAQISTATNSGVSTVGGTLTNASGSDVNSKITFTTASANQAAVLEAQVCVDDSLVDANSLFAVSVDNANSRSPVDLLTSASLRVRVSITKASTTTTQEVTFSFTAEAAGLSATQIPFITEDLGTGSLRYFARLATSSSGALLVVPYSANGSTGIRKYVKASFTLAGSTHFSAAGTYAIKIEADLVQSGTTTLLAANQTATVKLVSGSTGSPNVDVDGYLSGSGDQNSGIVCGFSTSSPFVNQNSLANFKRLYDLTATGTTLVTQSAANTFNAEGATTTAVSNLTVTGTTILGTATFLSGTLSASGGYSIAAASGDLTLDASTDIILDADGGDIFFKDGGTTQMQFTSGTNKTIDIPSGNLTVSASGSSNIIFETSGFEGDFGTIDFKSTVDGTTTRLGSFTTLGLDLISTNTIIAQNSLSFMNGATSATNVSLALDSTPVLGVAGNFTIDCSADITLDADGGEVFFKDAAVTFMTASSTSGLTLQNPATNIAANDVLGVINFQAPNEGTGTDAILVAAGIAAVSEGDFSASNNATKLSFRTGASETATEKMSLSSGGNLSFPDNGKVIFGAGDDLQIYHDGNNSRVEDTGTGGLRLIGSNFVSLQSSSGEDKIVATSNGAVTLYHNNAAKLATTSTGIDITGTTTTDGLVISGVAYIQSTTQPQLEIAYNSSNITGFYRSGGDFQIKNDNGSGTPETSIVLAEDGAVSLYHDASAKLATTSTGIDITGTATMDGLTVDGASSGRVTLGTFTNATNAAGTEAALALRNQATGNADVSLVASRLGANFGSDFYIETSDGVDGTNRKRLNIAENGDISFYEDTGSTAKFFWDSSAESLGIGTTSPIYDLQVGSYGTDSDSTLALASTNSGTGSIRFGDGTSGVEANAGKISYDHSNNSMQFATGGGTERMRIDSSGRVGIGTTSPSGLLDLTTTSITSLDIQGGDGNSKNIIFRKTTGSAQQAKISAVGDDLRFTTGTTTERMRIDSSGNVLVGTTDSSVYNNSADGTADNGINLAASGQLFVGKSGGVAAILNRTSSDGAILQFNKSGALVGSIDSSSGGINQVSAANYTVDATGDITLDADGGDIFFKDGGSAALSLNMGSLGTAEFETSRGILKFDCAGRFLADLSDGSGTHRFDINFNSGNDLFETLQISNPSASVISIAVQCEDNDTVLNFNSQSGQYTFCRSSGDVNFSIDTSSSGPILKAEESDDDIRFQGKDGSSTITALTLDMSAAGAATFNDNVTAYSDRRLKDNIETLDSQLTYKMRGVSFTRIDGEEDREGAGVIAQEMEEALGAESHRVVLTADDEMQTKSVDYGRLTGYLIETIKDLKKEVDELRSELQELKYGSSK